MTQSDQQYYHHSARKAVSMVRAYRQDRHMRLIWLERAADYRECLVYGMRRRQGWTLLETIAGRRLPPVGSVTTAREG